MRDEQVGEHMKVRMAQVRIAPSGLAAAVAAALLSAAVGLVSAPAGAAPSTKYYTSTATPSSVDAVEGAHTTVTFTLTNCGSTTAGCTKASTQSWGSAHVTLPSTWDWGYTAPTSVTNLKVHKADGSLSDKTADWAVSNVVTDTSGNVVVQLGNDGTSSTYAVAPGEYLTFDTSLLQTPAGLAAVSTEVKQSNDFSGTGNDFLHGGTNTDPTIVIGPPDHLEFGVPPQTVQVSTSSTSYYMCDDSKNAPTVKVVDKNGNTVSWVTTDVTVSSTGAPGLKYLAPGATTASTTLKATTSQGVATFGAACTSGLFASNLGVGYVMSASAIFGSATLTIPGDDQKSFDVLQYYQPCGTSCDTKTIVKDHTGVDVQGVGNPASPSTNHLAASVGLVSPAGTCSGDDGNTLRSIVSVDLANHSKNVLLSWDKQAVQVFVNNGTPFWTVCMWGTYAFPTRDGNKATAVLDSKQLPTGFFVGVLPDCGAANVSSSDPCIASLYRRAGIEYASVTLPLTMPGDPQFK